MQPLATIVFTTHNRRDLLRQAIESARNQSVPVKILVMDDASTDGTDAMMAGEFSGIDYYRSSQNLGPCYHRNKAMKLAETDIVFGLDDDSVLQSPFTIEQTLKEFDDEHIGAVAIPYINVLQSAAIYNKTPSLDKFYLIHAFSACAYAIRREVCFNAGGYREQFFYMGEESDLCIRMLQQGFVIRLGRADPIHHLQPPNRVSASVDMFERRNDILSFYCNTPALLLLPYLAGTTLKGLLYGIKVGRFGNAIKGFFQGYNLIFKSKHLRSPISLKSFWLYRKIKRQQNIAFSEIAKYLK